MNGGGNGGGGVATSGNISELDSLLQDLSNARYGSGIEKKCEYINRNITWRELKGICIRSGRAKMKSGRAEMRKLIFLFVATAFSCLKFFIFL